MSGKAEILNRRKPNSRKKWYEISARFINGETRELAKFAYQCDAYTYVTNLQDAPTVDEIYID